MQNATLTFLCALILLFMGACSRTMDDIIANEPRILGTVIETTPQEILVDVDDAEQINISHDTVWVCLDVEHRDSMRTFNVGDVVYVYYDGEISDTKPGEISKVYAITLLTPADRTENNVS